MAAEVERNERIKALILQHDDSIQYKKKLLDFNLTEMILSVVPLCMNNHEMLDIKIHEKLRECEQLKIRLEAVREKVAKLCSKYEENTLMKEFLDFASFLSKFRHSAEETNAASNLEDDPLLHESDSTPATVYITEELKNGDERESKGVKLEFDKPIDDGGRLKPSGIVPAKDPLALDPDLEKALELLNVETLKRQQAECERNKLEKFSDKLCHLLFKYKKLIDAKKTNTQPSRDHLNTFFMKMNFSRPNDDLIEINENDSAVKKEIKFSQSPLSIQDDSSDGENINSEVILPRRNELHSEVSAKTSNLSAWHRLRSFVPIQGPKESQSQSYSVTGSNHDVKKVASVDRTARKSSKSREPLKKKGKSTPSRNRGVQCNTCNEWLCSKSSLRRHILHRHTEFNDETVKSHKCRYCSKKFARKESLQAHASVHSKKTLKCNLCSKTFCRKEGLEAHKLVHSTKKRFKCPICSQRFRYLDNKMKHGQTVHGGELPFQCAHCDKGYFRKNDLVSHMHTLHFTGSQKLFKCTVCDKSFPLQTYLNKHKLVHIAQKPFKCSMCGNGFKRRNHRKRHEWMVHGRGDCFRCAHCCNVYSLKRNLLLHLKQNHIEEPEKPFKCTTCGKGFLRVIHRTRHEWMAHGNTEKYRCAHCRNVYNLKHNLLRHLRRCHIPADSKT